MSNQSLNVDPPASRRQRRASIRYRCDRHQSRRVFLVESYQSLAADVHDLSFQGVGLICDRAIPAGALIFVDLIGLEMGVEFLARVIHCIPCAAGRWTVGCQFERPLTDGELALILDGPR